MPTLKEKLMQELEGTQTKEAFERGGKEAFRRFQALSLLDDAGSEAFFIELLGQDLADRIIKANDIRYGDRTNLRNHYIIWARVTFGNEWVKEGAPEQR